MTKYLAAALLVLSACGGHNPSIDPAFQPFVDSWNSYYNQMVNVDIAFAELGASPLGEIEGECSSAGKIFIAPEYWPNKSYQMKEELLFHELGHCVLFLGHDRARILDPNHYGLMPRSIMYPYSFGDYVNGYSQYAANIDYYHAQLAISTASEP